MIRDIFENVWEKERVGEIEKDINKSTRRNNLARYAYRVRNRILIFEFAIIFQSASRSVTETIKRQVRLTKRVESQQLYMLNVQWVPVILFAFTATCTTARSCTCNKSVVHVFL